MTSKSEKLRKKRIQQGRPRRQDVPRYETGKIQYAALRPETEQEVKSVAISARRRVHGYGDQVPEKLVASPYAGYVLGRLFLDGKITKEEREAGDEYALAMSRYYNLLGVTPSVRAQEIFRVSGYSGEVTEEFQRAMSRATNVMMHYESILLQCKGGHQVKSTTYNVAVMDYEGMRFMPETQLRLLRRGLQAIAETMTCQNKTKQVA
jgi:hypothetical protein